MRVIIFDLDLTLASTDACHAYLRTKLGRATIVEALRSKEVGITFYGPQLVSLFNSLQAVENCCVAVVSDSPKDYCIQVLAQGGYNISDWLVFGGQSKPLVNQDNISSVIALGLGVNSSDLSFLIVGDSPKDIYYAHSIKAPSIFASWGSKQTIFAPSSQPTAWASNVNEVESLIAQFLNGELPFRFYDFKGDYLTVDPTSREFERVELSDGQIGFGKDYIKDKDHYRDKNDRWASFELRWIVKQAKNISPDDHDKKIPIPIYSASGLKGQLPFKKKAYFFKNDFLKWYTTSGVKGKVLLVPVPPSVPRGCNLTHSMSLMCHWWKYWITSQYPKADVHVHDVFERYWPKVPSHLTPGRRDMDEQFETLGVFLACRGQVVNVDFVIIVDDVVTSGSHMNAVASFIRTAKLVNESAAIRGYALYKTLRTQDMDDPDIDWDDVL